MSSEMRNTFTKQNLETYLKELAKEYRKLEGKRMPAEIILIGGASILINYGFREMTTDIDALIQAASTMKEAINRVGDRYDLPNGWLNEDFKRTDSYTSKLTGCSAFYKKYYGVMTVRTVSAEFLIAMKLKAGRQYKNDLSDVIGILAEHDKLGVPITREMIKEAVTKLYGQWEALPESSIEFLDNVMKQGDYGSMMKRIVAEERKTKEALIEFEERYPETVNQDSVENIIRRLRLSK